MAQGNWSGLKIEIDPTDGGALQDISAQVREIQVGKQSVALEEFTAAGASFEAWLNAAIKKMEKITLKGPLDDTASTGNKAIFVTSAHIVTRTLKLTYITGTTTTVEVWINEHAYTPKGKGMTDLEVVLQPTSTITNA